LINSYKSNPRAHIFAEPLGVVIFDDSYSKDIAKMNKKKNNDPTNQISEPDFLKWCKARGKKFYCFHGEHRRASLEYLHSVNIFVFYLYLLTYNYSALKITQITIIFLVL